MIQIIFNNTNNPNNTNNTNKIKANSANKANNTNNNKTNKQAYSEQYIFSMIIETVYLARGARCTEVWSFEFQLQELRGVLTEAAAMGFRVLSFRG